MGLTLLPILAAGFVSTTLMQQRVTERAEAQLTNFLRLEKARIDRELDAVGDYVTLMANKPTLVEAVVAADGPASLDAFARGVVAEAGDSDAHVRDLRLLDLGFVELGRSTGASWQADDRNFFDDIVAMPRAVAFGRAFEVGPNDQRLPVATLISDATGNPVGLLIAEVDLSPIVDLVVTHEQFGETSEAHIAQPDVDGNAAFITLLRFERDAAFNKVVPIERDLPINQSLVSPEPTIIHSPDYRAEPSILAVQTLESTGWGLVVKIDADEALGLTRSIRNVSLVGVAITIAAVLVGWAAMLRPLVRRVRRISGAAETIAAGRYDEPIDDQSRDEVGDMARSIDRLARDLKHDITLRNAAEAQLVHEATHDALTGLANRQHAEDHLRRLFDTGAQATTASSVASTPHSLLFLDLDDFKLVNETWGHTVGDEVLVEVAKRLRATTPDQSLAARWGGDEFVLVLPNHDRAASSEIATSIETVFATPIATSVGEHRIHASLGVATTSGGTTDLTTLFASADAQVFAAKSEARRARLIPPETARLVEAALSDERIEAWYQPIFTIEGSADAVRIKGAEALVRLRSTDGSLIEPGSFLPQIAESRLARAIDRRVAELAIAQVGEWRRAGTIDPDFTIAVNLSAPSVASNGLAELYSRLATQHDVPTSTIVLELSEDVADVDTPVLAELRDAGFVLAIDDLGLKHSNLDRLLTSGAQMAKIDRRWLNDHVVLEGLVRTCAGKGMTVVAEGIETQEQLELVAELGVHIGQGFLIGRPQPSWMFVGLRSLNPDATRARSSH